MITLFQSIILGIVEGITEFLPISSTAHLVLTSKLLGISPTDFTKSFEIFIQLGAILSVVILYFKTIIKNVNLFLKLCVSFIPTAIVGLLLYKIIKNIFLDSLSVIAWSLLIGGILMIIFEKFKPSSKNVIELKDLTWKNAFLIGVFQSLAVIPGVSRAASTIIGGGLLGLKKEAIVEYSFLLAVPTMLAATSFDLMKNYQLITPSSLPIFGVGFVVSFLTALLAIKTFLGFIKNHDFKWFGVYRIIIGLVILLFI